MRLCVSGTRVFRFLRASCRDTHKVGWWLVGNSEMGIFRW
jgi:hypothetical protein